MKRKVPRKKQNFSDSRRRTALPVAFILLSLLLMALPLESPVASVKAVLSYVFIPQIRAAHGAVSYAEGVNETVRELLSVHRENERLKEDLSRIRLENAQAREIFAENERLSAALKLRPPRSWRGVWAKTAYREPTQWNSVIVDKGSADGVRERAAAIVSKNGAPVLAGVVMETDENTAKVLLVQDEDFAAAVYTDLSSEEGLLSGAGAGPLKLEYLPSLSKLREGENVYTSPFSAIFPAGILVGKVLHVYGADADRTARWAQVAPEADASSVRELFILTREDTGNKK